MSLGQNSLSGKIPISFTKLSSFNLYFNNFTSTLPSDMSGFQNLELFNVAQNSFSGPFPKSLFSVPSLQMVSLEGNQFTGTIEFANTSSASKLWYLNLGGNRFNGPIPQPISEFLNLNKLNLSANNFSGTIPRSISKLVNLEEFHLSHKSFTGPIPRSISELVNLTELHLSHNSFSGPIPRSISKLVNLDYLDLSSNMIVKVPGCLWKLKAVTLSHNFFTTFENSSQEALLQELNLNSDSFQGPFPYTICKLRWLSFLDLSNNLFSGSIPSCLHTSYLTELILGNNSFSGTVPDIFANATKLVSFDVSRNQIEGKLPKSLINCNGLQLVNVQSNKIKDKFPSWLGSLSSFHVLILRSNEFHGPLYHEHMTIGFQSLRIIDISQNGFTGTLPPHYFSDWCETTTLPEESGRYMEESSPENYTNVFHTMEMVNKGVDMSFEKILQDFRAIDFSGNKFYGKIPKSVGFLKGLRLLNLSANAFTNHIPRFLANLTKLESLDLSRNRLSGRIPEDLGNLSFLSYMNFSHNLLQGPVPRGTQFQRQKCSSFLGNPRLYGLEEVCGKPRVPNSPSQQPEEMAELEESMFNWVAAAIAYGPGVFCGLVIGRIFTSRNHEWFK